MGGEATVTDPVSVHLQYLNSGDIWVLNQVVQLIVGAKGGPLDIKGDFTAVVYMNASYRCLQRLEITEERTLVGGW